MPTPCTSCGGLKTDVVLGNHPSQNKTFEKQAAKTPEHNPFIDPDGWDKFLDWVWSLYRDLLEKDPM